ncbi:Cytosolic iron-sulfur protein assembly protein [Lecanora helva]
MPSTTSPPKIKHLATLSPPHPTRSWLTAPHPTLPILATCSSDKTVRIYSLTSYTLLSTISGGHKRTIRSCAWKPNLKGESVLATGSFDYSVGIWRRHDDGAVKGIDFDARDREIEIGGEAEEEEDPEEWHFALVLDGHDKEVKSVSWSPAGNFLATCSRDQSIWIWEEVAPTGDDEYETIAVLRDHEADIKCVSWHPEEELLASGSYDDDIRLWREDVDDWGCCAVLRGHEGTVWSVGWEGLVPQIRGEAPDQETKATWMERREKSGPRLLSCSDDLTIRVWRRRLKEKIPQNRLSIIRTGSNEEDWVEEARLPVVHSRPVYAAAWSKSGRVVSAGGDGAIYVYEERWKCKLEGEEKQPQSSESSDGTETASNIPIPNHDTPMPKPTNAAPEPPPEPTTLSHPPETELISPHTNGQPHQSPSNDPPPDESTEWVIIAHLESAHDVFEINHVTWAPKPGSIGEDGGEGEELIVTTGDDGVVKVWELGI